MMTMNDRGTAALAAAPLVQTRGLTKRYGSVTALDHLDLDIAAGRIVGLLGPNGSGKTTLLKVLAGVLADYEGEARLFGEPPGLRSKALVSYLPDASYLEDRMTPAEAMLYFSDFYQDFDYERCRALLDYFRLGLNQPLRNMSKGMREKVQVSLVMSRRARLYLLDEPISGVDPASRSVILEGILGAYDPDSCLVISTHLIADIEPILDEVLMIDRGALRISGNAEDLREEHGMSIDQLFRELFREGPAPRAFDVPGGPAAPGRPATPGFINVNERRA